MALLLRLAALLPALGSCVTLQTDDLPSAAADRGYVTVLRKTESDSHVDLNAKFWSRSYMEGCSTCRLNPNSAAKLFIQESSDGFGSRLMNIIYAMAFAHKNGMNFGGVVALRVAGTWHGKSHNVNISEAMGEFFDLKKPEELFIYELPKLDQEFENGWPELENAIKFGTVKRKSLVRAKQPRIHGGAPAIGLQHHVNQQKLEHGKKHYIQSDRETCPDRYLPIRDYDACKQIWSLFNAADAVYLGENRSDRPTGCYMEKSERLVYLNEHPAGEVTTEFARFCSESEEEGGLVSHHPRIDDYLSEKFLQSLRDGWNPLKSRSLAFDENRPSVAVHVRRGDVISSSTIGVRGVLGNERTTSDEWYFWMVENIRKRLPNADVHVFSSLEEKHNSSEFDGYRMRGMTVHLNDTDIFEPWAHLAAADVTILAKSVFGHIPALFNTNCVVYTPYTYDPLVSWIRAADGSIGYQKGSSTDTATWKVDDEKLAACVSKVQARYVEGSSIERDGTKHHQNFGHMGRKTRRRHN